MQLLSIENLSLAAEATVILLLLAIAWHPRRKEPQHAQNGVEGISWEPAKYFYLQAFIHRGLYLQQWRETQSHNSPQSTDSKPFIPVVVDDDDNKPIMPAPCALTISEYLGMVNIDKQESPRCFCPIDSHSLRILSKPCRFSRRVRRSCQGAGMIGLLSSSSSTTRGMNGCESVD